MYYIALYVICQYDLFKILNLFHLIKFISNNNLIDISKNKSTFFRNLLKLRKDWQIIILHQHYNNRFQMKFNAIIKRIQFDKVLTNFNKSKKTYIHLYLLIYEYIIAILPLSLSVLVDYISTNININYTMLNEQFLFKCHG